MWKLSFSTYRGESLGIRLQSIKIVFSNTDILATNAGILPVRFKVHDTELRGSFFNLGWSLFQFLAISNDFIMGGQCIL